MAHADGHAEAHAENYEYRAFGFRPWPSTLRDFKKSVLAEQQEGLHGVSWAAGSRLAAFADDNGLRFTASGAVPRRSGAVFAGHREGRAEGRISAKGRPAFEIGTLVADSAPAGGARPTLWSYLTFELGEVLPHAVAEPVGSGSLSRLDPAQLPPEYAAGAALVHEVDDIVTIYARADAAGAVLDVVTPEVMGLLVDETEPFSLEIVGKRVVVFGLIDPRSDALSSRIPELRMRRLLGILDAMGIDTGVRAALPQASEEHPVLDYYADHATRKFTGSVIGLGVVAAFAIALGILNAIWPGILADAARTIQGR